MSNRLALIGLLGSAAVAAMVVAGGCGGDKKTDDLGAGGDDGQGGSAAVGGSASNGGASAGGSTQSTAYETDPTTGAYICRKGVPTSEVIAPGTNGLWGTSSAIAGGTFKYQDVDASAFAVDLITTQGSAVLTATIAAKGYAGYGIYFKDPEKCWDASKYTGGIRMTIGGNLGGGQLQFQVQTNANYPIDTDNNKGGCTGTWSSGCGNNTATVTVADTATAIDVPWSTIINGNPQGTTKTSELLGIQWQLNCPTDATAPCTPNFTIGAVSFY